MSEQKATRGSPPFIYTLIIVFLLAIMIFLFFSNGIFQTGGEQSLNFSYFLSLFAIVLLIVTFTRFIWRVPMPPQRVTLTSVQCAKCSFKNIRNFHQGDYIPKSEENCPSCGGPLTVEAIYMEEKPVKRRFA